MLESFLERVQHLLCDGADLRMNVAVDEIAEDGLSFILVQRTRSQETGHLLRG